MAKITKEYLEGKTIAELRKMVVHDFGIPGMTKKRKSVIIQAIMKKVNSGKKSVGKGASRSSKSVVQHKPVTDIKMTIESSITNPHKAFGNKATTKIIVACGASKGKFAVAGKTIAQIKVMLGEVLNIPKGFPQAMVNGKKVDDSYVAKKGDQIEILKPAGKKGFEWIIHHINGYVFECPNLIIGHPHPHQ